MLGNGNIVQGREGGRKQKKETPIPQTDNGRKKKNTRRTKRAIEREGGKLQDLKLEKKKKEKNWRESEIASEGLGVVEFPFSTFSVCLYSVFLSLIILFCFLFF